MILYDIVIKLKECFIYRAFFKKGPGCDRGALIFTSFLVMGKSKESRLFFPFSRMKEDWNRH